MRRYFKFILLLATILTLFYLKVFAAGYGTDGFLVRPSVNQQNLPVGTLTQINFGTEVYDPGGNFASNTFTAPATGKYLLSLVMRVNELHYGATYIYVEIDTSNRDYEYYIDPNFSTVLSYGYSFKLSILADMDQNDTAIVNFYQLGGSGIGDIVATETWFSGVRVM